MEGVGASDQKFSASLQTFTNSLKTIDTSSVEIKTRTDFAPALKTAMEAHVKGKRPMWRKIFSNERKDKAAAEAMEIKIIQNGDFDMSMREGMAKLLIAIIDTPRTSYCGEEFETAEEYDQHQMQCAFRTVTCKNEGCEVQYSFQNHGLHQEGCPHRLLLCNLNCGQEIKRKDMEAHCNGPCPKKIVPCKFESLGCTVHLPQGELDEHLEHALQLHFTMAIQEINLQWQQIAKLKEEIKTGTAGILALQTLMTSTNATSNKNFTNIWKSCDSNSQQLKDQKKQKMLMDTRITKLNKEYSATTKDFTKQIQEMKRDIEFLKN